MLKSQKIHPAFQFGIYVFAYCILLAVIIMFSVDIGETLLSFDLENTDINAMTYLY